MRLRNMGTIVAILFTASSAWATTLKPVDIDPTDDSDTTAPPVQDTAQPSETAPLRPERPTPPSSEPTAGPESVEPAAPGQDYTVKAGDTLWDISGSYLSSPWFWPKLWSYNPQIPNPNWIYPGNQIHFAPGGNAQLSSEAPPPEPQLRSDEDVTLTGKIGYTPSSATLIQSEGFITATELAESGSIVGSPEEKSLLSSLDSVYIKFGKSSPQPGDRFLVFRTVREVRHPVTGHFLGYLTVLRGTVKITAQGTPLTSGIIDRSFNTIERGDLVGPWGERFLRNVALKRNERDLGGYIVATLTPMLLNIGEDHVVFIDRGRRDGVQEGNQFDVLERRDGLEEDFERRWVKGFPTETIGKLLIIDAKETTSEALVVNSVRELLVGDHIQMLASH